MPNVLQTLTLPFVYHNKSTKLSKHPKKSLDANEKLHYFEEFQKMTQTYSPKIPPISLSQQMNLLPLIWIWKIQDS